VWLAVNPSLPPPPPLSPTRMCMIVGVVTATSKERAVVVNP
jgi:hypothetical protein